MYEFVLACALNQAITAENFEKISSGMTRAEVIKILGRPPDKQYKMTEFDRLYDTRIDSMEMKLHGQVWTNGSLRIWVDFDDKLISRGRMLEQNIR